MRKLTNAKIRKMDTPGLYTVDPTLYLRITDRGKYFVQRIMIQGKRRELGMGAFPVVSIDEAREAAFNNRRMIRAGGDPLEEKRKAMKPTFEAAAMATLETLRSTWRNGKTEIHWIRSMEIYVYPKIGNKRIDRIDRADVLNILTPLWTEKHETARRVRGWIKSVFSWAQSYGHVEANPAGEGLDGALPKRVKKTVNHRALHHSEVGAALLRTDQVNACNSVKLCLRFVAFTAVRSGEARLAKWSEINCNDRVWIIPADRTKTNREHRVPLSDAALSVLREAEELRGTSNFVFPSPRKPSNPLSYATKLLLLDKAGLRDVASVHGFRSSFRDWCADTGKPREVAELSLAHTIPGVEGAYFRSDLFDRRRLLMDQWAAYVTGAGADVVKLRSA